MTKYRPTIFKAARAFNGFRCELSVPQKTLEALEMSMSEFFEAANPFVQLQAETFYNLCALLRIADAPT